MNKHKSLWPALFLTALPFFVPGVAQADDSTSSPKSETKSEVAAEKSASFGDSIPWRLDMAKARAEAKSSGKPLLIYFFADWCPHCKNLEATAFQDKRVLLLSDEFVSVPIDGDGGPGSELMATYGAKGFPSIPVLNADDQVIERLGEYVGDTAGIYARTMAEILEKNGLPRIKREAAKDLSAKARLAAYYIALNKTNEAENLLEEAAQTAEKTNAKNERLAVANIALADLYMAQRDYTGAIVMLEHAMKVAEKGYLVEAQIKLGYSLLESGNKPDAIKHLTAAKESPDASGDARELANQFLAKAGA